MSILHQTLRKAFNTVSAAEIIPALKTRLDPLPLQWSSEELETLLYCEQNRPLCSAYSTLSPEVSAQTLLVGCDVFAGRLLLDEFFPQIDHCAVGHAIKLILPAKTGRLHVRAVVDELVDTPGFPCVLVSITDKHYFADRRAWPRTYFASSEQPPIKLTLPMREQRLGRLMNVSANGFMMSIPALDKPFVSGETGQCHIEFHDSFQLHAKVKVQSVQLLRKPYRNAAIRGVFSDLTDAERERLNHFVTRHKSVAENQLEN